MCGNKVYSAAGMKLAEGQANGLGYGYYDMMLAAGKAVAAALPVTPEDRVLVVCGGGNNGGDGYVIARELFGRKIPVAVYAVAPPKTEETARAYAEYPGEWEPLLAKGKYTAVVECFMGTGFSGEPKGECKAVLQTLNEIQKEIPLYAVDIPAGLNADTGEGKYAVKATQTFAIEGYKFGHFLGDGMDTCGTLTLLPIRIGGNPQAQIVEESLVKKAFPPLKRNLHKGSHGRATLIAGSKEYSGAARLASASLSALLTGAGYAELCSIREVLSLAGQGAPELILTESPEKRGKIAFSKRFYSALCNRSRVIAVGAGMGVSKHTYRVVCYLLKHFTGTLIVDADGLNALAQYGAGVLKSATARVVLTPHPAEFSRLTGKTVTEVLSDPYTALTSFCKETGAVCLLKGAATLISDGEQCYLSVAGSSAMAKGGSGDVLLGIAAGMFTRARELDLSKAEVLAAACFVAGKAGELAAKTETVYTALPSDTVKHLKQAMNNLLKEESDAI